MSPVRGMLASDPEHIFLGSPDGTLSSYESGGLNIAWRSELGGEFASEILVVENGIFVVTNSVDPANGNGESSTLRLIGKDSGVTAWTARLPMSKVFYLGRLNGGIAAVSQQGSVNMLDPATGTTRWQTGPYGTVSAKPAFSAGRLLIGTEDKQVIAISPANGQTLSKVSFDHVPTSLAFTGSGGILVGDERGNVALLASGDGKPVWKFKSGARVSSLIETDEGILVASFDNFVYFLSDYNGDVIWKRRLPGRIVDGGLVLDDYLMVLIYGEHAGFAIDMKSGKVLDVLRSSDREIVSRSPVRVNRNLFAIAAANSLETYSVGSCGT